MQYAQTPFTQLLAQIDAGNRLYQSWPHELLFSALSLMGNELTDYLKPDAPPLEGDARIGYDYVETLKRAAATLTGELSWMQGTPVPEEY